MKDSITTKQDFYNLRRAKKIKGKMFFIRFLRNPANQGKMRFTVIVSKKQGSAVTRNKIKRRIRDLIRQEIKIYNNNLDLLVIANTQVKDCHWQDLVDTMKNCVIPILKENL